MSSSSTAPDRSCHTCTRRADRRTRLKRRLRTGAQVTTGAITVANVLAATTLLLLGRPQEASACAAVAGVGLTTNNALARGKQQD